MSRDAGENDSTASLGISAFLATQEAQGIHQDLRKKTKVRNGFVKIKQNQQRFGIVAEESREIADGGQV